MTVPEYVVSCRAYCKMILHALKYPHSSVLGVLVAEKGSSNPLLIVDAVPVRHLSSPVAVGIEAALCQVDSFCLSHSPKWQIVGIYHANENLNDTSKGGYLKKIAEKIHANYSDAVLLTICNNKLSAHSTESCFIANSFSPENKAWEPVPKNRCTLDNEEKCLETSSACIQTKMYRDLVDFDNHLDNPALDFWNTQFNSRIESLEL